MIEHNKSRELKKSSTFIFEKNTRVILDEGSKIILEFNNGYPIWIGYYPDLFNLKEFNKVTGSWKKKGTIEYINNRKEFYSFIDRIIPISILLILWILFSYYKKMGLHISSFGLALGLIFTLSAPLIFFIIVNIGIILFSWLFFDKNPLIPEEYKRESVTTDLILQGYELYKKKDYSDALIRFKKAVQMDPKRYDVVKLITTLETKVESPEKLPFLINFKNKLFNK